ncbi:hypothetical protein [Rathayibacter sp. SD072]|uniref:hypothetical protein n=1 Tax=Rathayibacter sp. SD072 TaxID=2781731 RepID=UPI001A9646AF|nr:hypothetical protein [Rathayibacter sp. SD072]MBO0984652.1 hypothetical protein [Rathayibacter sp. SD072]
MAAHSTSLVIEGLGQRIEVDHRSLNGVEQAVLERLWSRTTVTGGPKPARSRFSLHRTDTPFEHDAAMAIAEVTLRAIEAAQGSLLMLHACALADPAGAAIVLVGPSGRGKTTAAATLGRSYGYLTDETTGITPGGRILPYEKPLLIRTAEGMPKRPFSPDELGLLPAPADPRLAALVILDRDPYLVGPAQLELLDLADAIPLLVPETSALSALENGIPTLARLAAGIGGVHRVRYRDAEQLVPIVAGLLETPPASEDRWSEVPGRNAVTDGQRVIVLATGTVHVLDGIAATIWQHPHLTGAALTTAVTARHGHADDAAKRVHDAAASLVAIGLRDEE